MAFLRLNGVTIPVSDKSGSSSIRERSMRSRSNAGDYRTDIVVERRRYQFTTTPLTEMEALALGGLINGDGDVLTFDDTTASSKGIVPALVLGSTVSASYSTTVPTGFSGKSGSVDDRGELYDLGIGFIKANQDLTINLWTNPSATNPVTNEDFLFNIYDTDYYKNSFRAFRHTDGALKFEVSAPGSSGWADSVSTLSLADPFDGSFKMLTFVLRRNPESGELNQYLYVNSVLSGSATTANIPNFANTTKVIIGSSGEVTHDYANKMDDFQILPYAATADMVSDWYTFGQNVGLHPKLKMDGDVTRDTIVDVVGKVTEKKFIHASGATKQILTFDLEETA